MTATSRRDHQPPAGSLRSRPGKVPSEQAPAGGGQREPVDAGTPATTVHPHHLLCPAGVLGRPRLSAAGGRTHGEAVVGAEEHHHDVQRPPPVAPRLPLPVEQGGLEMPVLMCASLLTCAPRLRRRCRRKPSMIWIIESPVASTRRRPPRGRARAPRRRAAVGGVCPHSPASRTSGLEATAERGVAAGQTAPSAPAWPAWRLHAQPQPQVAQPPAVGYAQPDARPSADAFQDSHPQPARARRRWHLRGGAAPVSCTGHEHPAPGGRSAISRRGPASSPLPPTGGWPPARARWEPLR